MSLIVETGEGLSNSESYATAAELVIYAGKYGVTVPATEAEQEALLRRAAVSMNAMTWKGSRANADQALAWPRRDVVIEGEIRSKTMIPREIQYGQMALAAETHNDDVNPPQAQKGAVIRERVEGAVEREYATITNESGRVLPVSADKPSRTLFADYLLRRGLFAIRA
nr:DnaT-like ssDNA-binding protein [uncultured Pseudomonas sp.]